VDEKILHEHLAKAMSWDEAHLDWDTALESLPAKHRGMQPPGRASFRVGIARTRANWAVGHPGIPVQSESHLAGFSLPLLVQRSGGAGCRHEVSVSINVSLHLP
jgi:hypothetical protein